MLLANSSVRKAAKTARVYQYATRGSIQGIVGIALLQSNGRKGRSPFNGWRPVPPSLFIQNHYAKSDTLGFFGTNSGSANEPLMGGSFFCGERGGNRSIGEANLRKDTALLWKCASHPSMAGTPRAPFNGSNAAHFLWKRDALCPFAEGME